MTSNLSRKRAFAVVAAAGLVVLLAATLALRVAAQSRVTGGPAGTVPAPKPIRLAELSTPYCWGCSWNEDAPLEFQVDLDLLAPLGTGAANAAEWFADFAHGESRYGEAKQSYASRMIELTIDGDDWRVLPGDDPLLLEAEAWVDQATCSFYPEIWQIDGIETPIANLLMMLDLARSWTARGKLADDPVAAVEDFRRAIRLGRLLRQDDVTLIQDLVAIACIRIGAEGLYTLARDQGDAATMLVSSLVLADKDAMRLFTARRITTFERGLRVADPAAPTLTPLYSTADVQAMIDLAREVTGRRFKMEGVISLNVVRYTGSPEQREMALAALEAFAASEDAIVATLARQYLDVELDDTGVREMLRQMEQPEK
jgi:hypothetical protein